MVLKIKNREETHRFGLALAAQLVPGDIVCLVGDLGTGKTALTQAVAEGLGITEQIVSPTFNIVKEYHSGRMPLYHFDVYRVHDPDSLFEIGIQDYFEDKGVCIIEWADLIEDMIPPESRRIFIRRGENPEERYYEIGWTE